MSSAYIREETSQKHGCGTNTQKHSCSDWHASHLHQCKDGWRQESSLEGLNKEEWKDVARVCCQHRVDGVGPSI